jgi:hypothetical protein
MKTWLLQIFLFITFLLSSFQSKQLPDVTDFTIKEKDLIPEGLAYDAVTQNIYVSSTYKCKIFV